MKCLSIALLFAANCGVIWSMTPRALMPREVYSYEVRGLGHLISHDPLSNTATIDETALREYENSRPEPVERLKKGVYYSLWDLQRIDSGLKKNAEAELRLMIAETGYILRQNSLEGVLADGADINLRGKDGWTALHRAIERNDYAMVQFLVQKGADVKIRADINRTPLVMEIEKGLKCNQGTVDLLLSRGADVNIKDIGRYAKTTLLSLAVVKCETKIVELLLMNGANVNLINDSRNLNGHSINYTALHELMKSGRYVKDTINKIKLLLQKGILINAKALDGQTALHMTAGKQSSHMTTKEQIEIVGLLIDKGADVNIKDDKGRTFLEVAEEYNQNDLVKLLIDKRDTKGRTSLHRAALSGSIVEVEALIQKRADIHILDNEGLTALKLALDKEYIQVAGKLLKADKADPSPLVTAVRMSDFRVVKYLLHEGVDVNIKGQDGITALHEAIMAGREDIVGLLFDYGANSGGSSNEVLCLFHDGVESKKKEIVELFLNSGINVNGQDSNGRTALHKIVLVDSIDIANMLLVHGADVSIRDYNGHTALHVAAGRNLTQMVKLLVVNGADIRDEDNDGHAAIFLAVQNGYERVVQQLIMQGASIQDIDKDGMSLLFLTVENGYLQVVKVLLEGGADVKAKDHEGYTVLHRAAMKGDRDIVELLIAKGAETSAKDGEGKYSMLYINGQVL